MLKLKPIWITLISAVLFLGILFAGMSTDWWMIEGRKTPLDGVRASDITQDHEEEITEETEDHVINEIAGSSTLQDALDLGISISELEEILQGPLDNTEQSIQAVVQDRGLRFGVVKDTLNEALAKK